MNVWSVGVLCLCGVLVCLCLWCHCGVYMCVNLVCACVSVCVMLERVCGCMGGVCVCVGVCGFVYVCA